MTVTFFLSFSNLFLIFYFTFFLLLYFQMLFIYFTLPHTNPEGKAQNAFFPRWESLSVLVEKAVQPFQQILNSLSCLDTYFSL